MNDEQLEQKSKDYKQELEEAQSILSSIIRYLPKSTSDSCKCPCCKAAKYVESLA